MSKKIPARLLYSAMWSRGKLRDMCTPGGQRMVYDFIKAYQAKRPGDPGPVVINAHRGLGKSACLALMACEVCLANPGERVIFCGPTQEAMVEILRDEVLPSIFDQEADPDKACPAEYRPVPKYGHTFIFNNPRWPKGSRPSELHVAGLMERGKGRRGFRGKYVFIDECRDVSNLTYTMQSVLGPLTLRKKDVLTIMISTPPDSVAHPFVSKYIADAKKNGSYLCIPTTDNPYWNDEEELKMRRLVGQPGDEAYNRELLCKLIGSKDMLAVPEFTQQVGTRGKDETPILRRDNVVVDHYPRPEFFFPVLGMDFGWTDYTAVVFGYVDFLEGKLIIEDELNEHYKSTGELAKLIKAKEYELYGQQYYYKSKKYGTPLYDDIRRWCDNNAQSIGDFRIDHGIYMTPAEKKGWEKSSLAQLKHAVKQEEIIIHSKCRDLIDQLEGACLNKSRTGFERQSMEDLRAQGPGAPVLGHFDVGVALMYLNRMVKPYFGINPYPEYVEIDWDRMKRKQPVMQHGSFQMTDAPLNIKSVDLLGDDTW